MRNNDWIKFIYKKTHKRYRRVRVMCQIIQSNSIISSRQYHMLFDLKQIHRVILIQNFHSEYPQVRPMNSLYSSTFTIRTTDLGLLGFFYGLDSWPRTND
jgi:hypothetical protein